MKILKNTKTSDILYLIIKMGWYGMERNEKIERTYIIYYTLVYQLTKD